VSTPSARASVVIVRNESVSQPTTPKGGAPNSPNGAAIAPVISVTVEQVATGSQRGKAVRSPPAQPALVEEPGDYGEGAAAAAGGEQQQPPQQHVQMMQAPQPMPAPDAPAPGQVAQQGGASQAKRATLIKSKSHGVGSFSVATGAGPVSPTAPVEGVKRASAALPTIPAKEGPPTQSPSQE
jgi:hypothetical protein